MNVQSQKGIFRFMNEAYNVSSLFHSVNNKDNV